jgi:hypothetical protein
VRSPGIHIVSQDTSFWGRCVLLLILLVKTMIWIAAGEA